MPEHLTENEIAGLVFAGLFAPALIMGGLAAVAIGSGICPSMVVEAPNAAVIMGGFAFGGGCGLLGVLGFYYWHRDLVNSQRDCDKMPLDIDELTEP